VRVLDMTRVIAGPVCTRFLSAYGADVLRVDPPGFAEVGALLPDMTAGKRRAALDLRRSEDRATFERLVAGADVLVCGYRSDALARLGYGARELRALNDALVLASLDAYGWTGPWRARRGFDSLVQMSSGIAARGGDVARVRGPKPLPAQALDHGTGYLLAAATCRALTRRAQAGETAHVRASLARTAAWLVALGESGDPEAPDFVADDARPWLETAPTAWGRVERVRCPGRVGSFTPSWTVAPGPLGSDSPGWES
jgi:crotonobetainyl-CoA:carnitine CoA-transferase CaiB-like acyl-CoA transferase